MNKKSLHKFFGILPTQCKEHSIFTFVKSCFFVALFLIPLSGNASHIVGGELNYTCLGSDQYEVTLTVYRDCFYGLADFDDPAAVGIFFSSGFLYDTLMLPLTNIDTLTPFLSDTCLFVPEDVCVSTTTYKRVVTLPFDPGGYVIAYQRCCRNQTINNIISPDNTGATFMVEISPTALTECNSNAKFEAWPPIFICVNEPINFSQAATDIDGDSIVYKLCTPLAAGDSLNNRPQPPLPPPYNEVVYSSPPYNVNNALGFGDPLAINSETGILTGTPSVKGQYVVGVCIEEYRNGALISTTRRDFQYNVGDCGITQSAFSAPAIQCEDLTVLFENQSSNTENFLWDFNDPNNPGATSTEVNPTYTYSDTGRYVISLITEPGTECVDTSFQEVYLKNSTIATNFEFEPIECNVDSITLQFNDTSVDSFSTPIAWEWTLSDGQTSTQQNPIFVIDASQDLTVTLQVESDDECFDIMERVLNIDLSGLPPFTLPSDTLLCGPSFSLTAGNQSNVNYIWATDEDFDNVIGTDPTLNYVPNGPQTLYIKALNAIGCERTGSINVTGNQIDVDIDDMDFLCLDAPQVINITNNDPTDNLTYQWTGGDIISGANTASPTFQSTTAGAKTASVTITDQYGCQITESFNYTVDDLPDFTIPSDTLVCGSTLSLTAGSVSGLNYTWASDAAFTNILSSTANLEFTPNGQQMLFVKAANAQGCEKTASINVRGNILDIQISNPAEFLCLGESQTINVTNNDSNDNLTYQWSPLTDITSGANTASPTFQPSGIGSRTATVTVMDEFGCQVQQSFSYTVLDTNIPADFISTQKCDGFTVDFEYDGTNLDFYTWDFGDNSNANGTAVSHTFASPGTYNVRLIPNTGLPCSLPVLERTVTVYESLRTLDFDWQYNACQNDAIIAFTNNSQTLQGEVSSYAWTFSNGLTSNQISPTILVPTTQTLTVGLTMTTTDGCTSTLSRNIEIEVVEFSLPPATQINCQGTPTQLNVGANPSYSYTWSPAETLDNPNSPSPLANPTANTTYNVTVTNGQCEVSGAVQLLVSNVTTSELADSLVVCSGGVALNQGVNNNPRFEYSWTPTQGLDDPSAANPIANPQESTVYTAVIRDVTNDCEVSRVIRTVVPEVPLAAGIDFDYETCLEEAVIQLRDISDNSEGFIVSWDWQLSNGMQFNSRNPVVTFDESQSVEISLTVQNLNGCVDTRTTQLDVQLLDVNTPESVDLCIGGDTELNPDANPDYTYKWFPTNSLDNSTAANPLASPNRTTEYTVTITDAVLGCQATKKVIARVPTYQTELDFGWDFEECGEDAVIKFNDLSSNDELGITSRSWTFSNGMTSTASSPTIDIPESQTLGVELKVVLEDGCEFELAPQEISIELIDFNPVDQFAICQNESVVLNEGADQSLFYTWSPAQSLSNPSAPSPVASPTSTTEYMVSAARNTPNGFCSVNRTVTVVVGEPLSLSLNTTDTTFCEPEFLLEATAIGGVVEWSLDPNFEEILAEGNTLLTKPSKFFDYYVRVTDDSGCINVDSVRLQSFALDYEFEPEVTACFGDTTTLSIFNMNPDQELSYQWSPDLNIIDGRFEADVTVSPLQSVEYMVEITNEFGCAATETINYTLSNLDDELTIEAVPPIISAGEMSLLFVTDNPDYTYNWLPSNSLSDPNISNPLANPNRTTTYAVIVRDENGCIGRKVITLEVEEPLCDEPFIFIPKGFTPNDDGKNDILYVRGNPIEEMTFVIYNRWGEQMFQTTDKNQGWDGTYKGKKLSPDVYGYYLKVLCVGGEEYFKKGNVTLIR